MTVLDALLAFVQEHEHCGELNSAVEGDQVWMTCSCGAAIDRSGRRRMTRLLVCVGTFG